MKYKLPNLPETSLTDEQADIVLNGIPLIVLADDDPRLLNAMVDFLSIARENMSPVLRFEGNMEKSFDQVAGLKEGQQAFVLCRDGSQALQATRVVAERKINNGLMLFDNRMGLPEGIDIFKEINGNLPPKITKGLMSGTYVPNIEEHLANGTLDFSLEKPFGLMETRRKIAEVYLRKISQ